MLSLIIKGATRILSKSQGYKGLVIRDGYLPSGIPSMTSAWEPTPDELRRLNEGKPIYITILGVEHPPILVEVGI